MFLYEVFTGRRQSERVSLKKLNRGVQFEFFKSQPIFLPLFQLNILGLNKPRQPAQQINLKTGYTYCCPQIEEKVQNLNLNQRRENKNKFSLLQYSYLSGNCQLLHIWRTPWLVYRPILNSSLILFSQNIWNAINSEFVLIQSNLSSKPSSFTSQVVFIVERSYSSHYKNRKADILSIMNLRSLDLKREGKPKILIEQSLVKNTENEQQRGANVINGKNGLAEGQVNLRGAGENPEQNSGKVPKKLISNNNQ